jgi:hypothetical protein
MEKSIGRHELPTVSSREWRGADTCVCRAETRLVSALVPEAVESSWTSAGAAD